MRSDPSADDRVIRRHDFNSDWWGAPAGIVTDPAFFSLAPELQRAELEPFAWAEFRHDLETAPPEPLLVDAGFALLDVQVGYRLELSPTPSVPGAGDIEVIDATDDRFEGAFEEMQSFSSERYLKIPGSSPERNDDRFRRWARLQVERVPQHSLELRDPSGIVQGWFLTEPDDDGTRLQIGMRRRGGTTRGTVLYDAAFSWLCRRGAEVGHATFSVSNIATMNVYAKLGARFTSSVGCWFNVGCGPHDDAR